jgi:hypothetical protein
VTGAHGHAEIAVRVTSAVPDCPRCGRPALLAADVPHSLDGPSSPPEGTVPVVLCASCDIGQDHAGPLIAFLLVHEQVTPALVSECADLLQRWVDAIIVPHADPAQVEAEYRDWLSGEL